MPKRPGHPFRYPTIGIGLSALSVEVVIPEFTDVFVATLGKGVGAKAVIVILVLD